MCRFCRHLRKMRANYQGRIQTRRRIACLPTIFEVVNEEMGTLNNTDDSRMPLHQRCEYKREAKEKNDRVGKVLSKTASRSMVLTMDIEATSRTLTQCKTRMRTVYPDFFPETTFGSSSISMQSTRVSNKNACLGLKLFKVGGKQECFEKERGIAAWLKFFG